MRDFRAKVLQFVKGIPRGRVASYGQIAAACGHPRAARQVGGILRGLDIADGKIPWWRVVNNQGIISIKGNCTATKEIQKALLEKEKIAVDKNFCLDMGKYRYKPPTHGIIIE